MLYKFLLSLICLCWMIPLISAQTSSCTGAPESRLVIGEQAQIIAEGGSNLRSRPSADATLLNVIPQDAIIQIIDGAFCAEDFAWWQVDYNGDRGWIAEGTGEFYWIAPYIIQRAQISNVRIELQPNLVTGITLERLAEPVRSQFILEGYPVQSQDLVPFIVIFDAAPDELEIPSGNAVSQLENIAAGMRFVDVYFTEPITSTESLTLIYHYMAVTEDSRFIDAYFPIIVPSLPLPYVVPESDLESYNEQYFQDTKITLDALSADDFTPTLSQLDGIVQSIQLDASLEESDLLSFSSANIQFDYNPVLATTITETIIPENSIPQHIELQFDNYPDGEAIIRIYRADNLSGSRLASLQQILSRQPANPPSIPVPSQIDSPLSREDIVYLDFLNGSGIRYRATFADNELFYSFQGLTESGGYFVSALFSIQDDYPPYAILDKIIQSMEIIE